jgi:rRNA processing protein Krr1/Pno1
VVNGVSKRYVRIIGSKRQVEAARILVERLMHGNELTAALPNEVSTLALTSTTAAAGFAAAGGGGGGDGGGKGAVEEEDDEEWEIEEREVVVPLDGFKRFVVAKGDRDKLVKEVQYDPCSGTWLDL